MSRQGKVWLVGAGPSDPGLFTLKGKRVLQKAEVVVYDALAGQAIFKYDPRGCRKDQCRQAGKPSSDAAGRDQQNPCEKSTGRQEGCAVKRRRSVSVWQRRGGTGAF